MSEQPAIPFFAGAREWAAHGDELLAAMASSLAAGRALQGPEVEAFEADLAAACGRRHAVAVGSATDALYFALAAHGIGPGDEVIVPALSFIASASCVLRAGARPMFADVDDAGLLDLASATRLAGSRTRAVIAVELFGQMIDPVPLEAFADDHRLLLVEDAAQALGARTGARRAGSVGTVSCLSFDPTKTVSAPGSGGALLCDDDELAAGMRRLRWHGRDGHGADAELGFNSQLPTPSAAALRVKLRHDAAWTVRRRAIAARYDDALRESAVRPLPVREGCEHVFHKYVVRAPGDRDALRRRLDHAGVQTLVHYASPLPRQPLFAASSPYAHAIPRADALAASVLSLPIHAFLEDAEIERVAGAFAD